jgi:hypothetical protein
VDSGAATFKENETRGVLRASLTMKGVSAVMADGTMVRWWLLRAPDAAQKWPMAWCTKKLTGRLLRRWKKLIDTVVGRLLAVVSCSYRERE